MVKLLLFWKTLGKKVDHFPTMQKCYKNFNTKDFQNYILHILELHAEFELEFEIENGLYFQLDIFSTQRPKKISIRLTPDYVLTKNKKQSTF